jgi:hypothetical protein
MKISKIKLRFCSLLLAFSCILSAFSGAITPVYADSNEDPSWLPDGYKIYKFESLDDGKIKYYLVPNTQGFHQYDEEGKSISFSPQMTYALYGTENSSLIEDETDLMKTIADYYDVGLDELTESLIYDYLWSKWDTSSSLSNSFSYSGIPDEDSFCFTTFENVNLDHWFNYAQYWVNDMVGANDWYVALENMLGWHNVYNSDAFNNYKNDFVTFGLYNYDDKSLFSAGTTHTTATQVQSNRWYEGNVVVSEYNVVKFQSALTTLLSSGILLFDISKVSTGLKTKLSTFFTELADGNWIDVFEYNDYKKIHTGEAESLSKSWLNSPVKNIEIKDNNLVVDIRDNYQYKVGYYIDYLVNSSYGKFILYRHYFYPETIGEQIILNGNSIETKLPFTSCSLDGTQDNTLIKGIGFFGYGLNTTNASNKVVAEFAPSRTAGMGDISFITAYDYYCLDYPFKDNETKNYGYDFNININDYECLVYIVDDGEVVDQTTEKIDYEHTFSDVLVTDQGTYIVNNITYNIDGNYIEQQINNMNDRISEEDKQVIFSESELKKCCEDCTCTIEKHCKNCMEIEGVLTCICNPNGIDCDCYKKSDSSDNDTDNDTTDDNYWKKWKEWVESCKKFIEGAPELFGYVFSWLPKPLVDFIVLSIMTGFGIAVIKVILRRE